MSTLKIGGTSYDDGVNWIVQPDIVIGPKVRELHMVEPPGSAVPQLAQINYKRSECVLAWAMAADSLGELYEMRDALEAEFDTVPTTLEVSLGDETTAVYLLWPPEEFPDLILGDDATIPTFQFIVPRFEIRPTRWAFAEEGS